VAQAAGLRGARLVGGFFAAAVVFTGEGIDLIDNVPSAGEIVTRLVTEAEHALASAAARVV